MGGFRLRYIGPVLLISACLVLLCAFTALSLFAQQAAVTRILRENVESRRAAVELEECISDLIALENDRVETVAVLHDRAAAHVKTVRGVADQPEEQQLAAELDAGFTEYLARWGALPPAGAPGHEATRRAVTKFLETNVLRPCERFKIYNAERIDDSAESHERALRRLIWGLAGIGGLGGGAGLVLGFGMARGLSRSIRRLRLQLSDVAGQLNPAEAELVITEQGDFKGLHAEADRLAARVVQTVRELQSREREVQRAEQLAAVGQLAAGVAHEIRNPLTAIKMLVQAAREDGGGLTREDLGVIESEVRRLEQSLQTFLDFARPPKLVRGRVDLADLLGSVLALLRGRADRQGVAVRLQTPAGGVPLHADGGQLRQVVLNLCMNALDAMPAGGRLSLRAESRAAGRVSLDVADTGPGIQWDIFARLFQPFVSGKETGLGLGLVISQRIVENHGGVISAANCPEGGALFTVTLPTEDARG